MTKGRQPGVPVDSMKSQFHRESLESDEPPSDYWIKGKRGCVNEAAMIRKAPQPSWRHVIFIPVDPFPRKLPDPLSNHEWKIKTIRDKKNHFAARFHQSHHFSKQLYFAIIEKMLYDARVPDYIVRLIFQRHIEGITQYKLSLETASLEEVFCKTKRLLRYVNQGY